MMPAFCPSDAPPGEKAVYGALQADPETDGWIVLHSLAIAQHVRQVQGEADFVLVVPDNGVLVLEVKSHRSIHRRSDGTWKLGRSAPTARSPFQQASDAMHSVRDYLHTQRIDLRSVPILHAVWFTGVRARTMLPANPEWHSWQVLDSEDLKAAPAAIRRTLAAGAQHLGNKIKYFNYGGCGPTEDTARRIVEVLRPRFEVVTVAGDRRRARDSQLATFVSEQYLALDAASDNQSVLFSGPAGTGKTLLAMESARREAALHRKGRLLCFNRLLGKRLVADMDGPGEVIVGTFHQELLRVAGIAEMPHDPPPEFWDEELPERAIEALLEGGAGPNSDFLIVDEVQDIATDPYLDVLDLMVEGGIEEGRVLMFGDFERQAIFDSEAGRERLRARAPRMASHKLVQNCRNLPRIGYQVNLLTHLQPGYQHFRRGDDGVDPTFHQYRDGQDQSALLVSAIRGLKEEGYALNEIVVLSPLRDRSTAANTGDPWLRQVLKPANGLPGRPGHVQYATIHSFKGLEAPAVVVTDLDRGTTEGRFDSLLYVGLTRATDRLIALIEASTLRNAVGGTA